MELELLTKDLPVSIDPLLFRHVMRKFATGVTVLTVRDGEIIHGMTANSFTSVSLSPTLVLVCILNGSTTHDFVSHAGSYAVNILSDTQVALAQRFAKQVSVPSEPFVDISYHSVATGAPIFDECLGYVDCRVVAAYPAGDHTIFVGEVLAAGFGQATGDPLLWLEGQYKSRAEE
ncbi:MAG: flavin reductase family protein [Chloroflexi bacterium]|nr:flavin reductase family protein [Chloroflexota bacterium]